MVTAFRAESGMPLVTGPFAENQSCALKVLRTVFLLLDDHLDLAPADFLFCGIHDEDPVPPRLLKTIGNQQPVFVVIDGARLGIKLGVLSIALIINEKIELFRTNEFGFRNKISMFWPNRSNSNCLPDPKGRPLSVWSRAKGDVLRAAGQGTHHPCKTNEEKLQSHHVAKFNTGLPNF